MQQNYLKNDTSYSQCHQRSSNLGSNLYYKLNESNSSLKWRLFCTYFFFIIIFDSTDIYVGTFAVKAETERGDYIMPQLRQTAGMMHISKRV